MSLINDALKRAHQSLKQTPPDMSTSPENPNNESSETPQPNAENPAPPTESSDVPEMQPVMTDSSSGGSGKGILVGVLCLLICAAAAWGIWTYINSSPKKNAAAKSQPTDKAAKAPAPAATNKLAKAKDNVAAKPASTPSAATTEPKKPLSNIVARTEAKLLAARAATGRDDFDNEGNPIQKQADKAAAPKSAPAPAAEKQLAALSKPVEKPVSPPAQTAPAPDLSAPTAKPVEKVSLPTPAQAPAPAPAEQPAPVATTTAKAQFPEVRLQGIFFRLVRPSAMLSGQTVYVGDALKGTNVKVKAIDRQSVTLELEGETSVLTMR